LASFMSITEVTQIYGPHCFPLKKFCTNFYKNGLGYILGDFFTNWSGHLVRGQCYDHYYLPILSKKLALFLKINIMIIYLCINRSNLSQKCQYFR
jgi:hypothetical protein